MHHWKISLMLQNDKKRRNFIIFKFLRSFLSKNSSFLNGWLFIHCFGKFCNQFSLLSSQLFRNLNLHCEDKITSPIAIYTLKSFIFNYKSRSCSASLLESYIFPFCHPPSEFLTLYQVLLL